jgi:mRNA-degrading endonuclease RelE of RelBE toxin-antitoxin system
MKTVAWQPKAVKQLKRLGDKAIQGRILAATAGLAEFPEVPNVKALNHHRYGYRLRVGDLGAVRRLGNHRGRQHRGGEEAR